MCLLLKSSCYFYLLAAGGVRAPSVCSRACLRLKGVIPTVHCPEAKFDSCDSFSLAAYDILRANTGLYAGRAGGEASARVETQRGDYELHSSASL